MLSLFRHPKLKTAQAPGTLTYTGEQKDQPVHVSMLTYSPQGCRESVLEKVSDAVIPKEETAGWISVAGIHSSEVVAAVGESFGIHALVLEDVMHVGQRPKVEHHDDFLFVVMKMIRLDAMRDEVITEQVSLLLDGKKVILFLENAGDVFEPVKQRIRNTQWRERKLGADYLAYALIDAVVDHYFAVLENLGDKIESLEEAVQVKAQPEHLAQIHSLKRDMIVLRKNIWPLREVVGDLQRGEYAQISSETRLYLEDVYDHAVQVLETVTSFAEMLSSMQDLYASMMGNRMNEVMKVLTIIATLFIPPTFLAGIYGMNFEWMPELKWPGGYFMALGIMFGMMLGMAAFFKHKKWF